MAVVTRLDLTQPSTPTAHRSWWHATNRIWYSRPKELRSFAERWPRKLDSWGRHTQGKDLLLFWPNNHRNLNTINLTSICPKMYVVLLTNDLRKICTGIIDHPVFPADCLAELEVMARVHPTTFSLGRRAKTSSSRTSRQKSNSAKPRPPQTKGTTSAEWTEFKNG